MKYIKAFILRLIIKIKYRKSEYKIPLFKEYHDFKNGDSDI